MADIVRGQIAYPEKPMPANLYRGTDASSVALYIAKCAGNPNCGVTAATDAAPPSGGATTTTGTSATAAGPDGKKIFSANCATCHTLKAAGATGTVGPNLDALKPSSDRVSKQVTNGGAVMPAFKGQLSTAEIQAVAKYVSSVAGG